MKLIYGHGYIFTMTAFPNKEIVGVFVGIDDNGLCEFQAGRQPGGYKVNSDRIKEKMSND